MSGLAKNFNKAIHDDLTAYAAWLPVVNTFRVGEFGFFSNGVFQSIGNIKDKYPDIPLKTAKGNAAQMNFASSGTKVTRINAGGKPVGSFSSLGNVEATLKISFTKENSSMIKARFSSLELKNIDEVARALAKKSDWQRKCSVVSKVYTGEKCVIVCSKEAGTEIEIKAAAKILAQVEAGKVDGHFQFSSNRDSVFKSIGETGTVALGLFKLNLFKKVKILKTTKGKAGDNYTVLKGQIKDDF